MLGGRLRVKTGFFIYDMKGVFESKECSVPSAPPYSTERNDL